MRPPRISVGIVAGSLLVGAVAAATVTTSSADAASTGVTIVKIVNHAYPDASSFPVYLSPEYTKTGPVVVDSAVFTVKNHDTGATVGAGRRWINVQPGSYDITTTVKYRTFVTTGSTTKVVAHTGDVLTGAPTSDTVASAYVDACHVTSSTFTETPPGPDVPDGAGTGTYAGTCDVRWGTADGSSNLTGSLAVHGTITREYSVGDDYFVYTFHHDVNGTDYPGYAHNTSSPAVVPTTFTSVDRAVVTSNVSHVFPVRKYSAEKSVKATYDVRRIIRAASD